MTLDRNSRIHFLVIQVQVYRGCSRKEDGSANTAVAPQAHLLQPAVIVERRKKYVLCVWRVLHNHATFWCKIRLIISCHGKIPTYAGNQKQSSEDKVTLDRPEKLRFGQRRYAILLTCWAQMKGITYMGYTRLKHFFQARFSGITSEVWIP